MRKTFFGGRGGGSKRNNQTNHAYFLREEQRSGPPASPQHQTLPKGRQEDNICPPLYVACTSPSSRCPRGVGAGPNQVKAWSSLKSPLCPCPFSRAPLGKRPGPCQPSCGSVVKTRPSAGGSGLALTSLLRRASQGLPRPRLNPGCSPQCPLCPAEKAGPSQSTEATLQVGGGERDTGQSVGREGRRNNLRGRSENRTVARRASGTEGEPRGLSAQARAAPEVHLVNFKAKYK